MDKNAALALAAAAVAIVGFNAAAGAMDTRAATATILDKDGQPKGTATVTAIAGGIHVEAGVTGMQPGTYGIHLHQVGACTGLDFVSAGSHWNPAMRAHGTKNPAGPHKGDLPNLEVGAGGIGRISADITGVALTGADGALLDADGAAIVVHAKPDDYMTDPSGNSGGRIACGVFKAG